MAFTVLVVDDSAFMRKAIRGMLEGIPGVQVVANARNGKEAVDLCQKFKPNLVTLDVEMPEMDGLTALRQISKTCPTDVVMVSSLTTEGSQAALTAMKLGAIDIIAKTNDEAKDKATGGIEEQLTRLVRSLIDDRGGAKDGSAAPVPAPVRTNHSTDFDPSHFDLLLIGSSTGGPPVLEKLVLAMPEGFTPTVVIAQHMPEVFTRSMAQRMASMAHVPVHHIEDGSTLHRGEVYICPGGHNTHLSQSREGIRCTVNREPDDTIYFPSVNVLYETASRLLPKRTIAITLTGMGDDGLKGAKPFVEAGGTLLAQNKDSCVVYGMPKAVVEADLASGAYTPDELAAIVAMLGAQPSRAAA